MQAPPLKRRTRQRFIVIESEIKFTQHIIYITVKVFLFFYFQSNHSYLLNHRDFFGAIGALLIVSEQTDVAPYPAAIISPENQSTKLKMY